MNVAKKNTKRAANSRGHDKIISLLHLRGICRFHTNWIHSKVWLLGGVCRFHCLQLESDTITMTNWVPPSFPLNMNNFGRKCSFLQHPPNRSFHALNIIVVYLGGWSFLHNKGKPFGELCWGWDSFLWDIVGKSIWQFESPKDGYPHISNEQLGDQKLRSNRGVNWKRGGYPLRDIPRLKQQLGVFHLPSPTFW